MPLTNSLVIEITNESKWTVIHFIQTLYFLLLLLHEKLRMLVMERVFILSNPNANSNCLLYSRFVNAKLI